MVTLLFYCSVASFVSFCLFFDKEQLDYHIKCLLFAMIWKCCPSCPDLCSRLGD